MALPIQKTIIAKEAVIKGNYSTDSDGGILFDVAPTMAHEVAFRFSLPRSTYTDKGLRITSLGTVYKLSSGVLAEVTTSLVRVEHNRNAVKLHSVVPTTSDEFTLTPSTVLFRHVRTTVTTPRWDNQPQSTSVTYVFTIRFVTSTQCSIELRGVEIMYDLSEIPDGDDPVEVSGDIAVDSVTVSGAVAAATMTASGAVTGGSLTTAGALTANSAAIAGAITSGSVTASGVLTGATANISGTATVGALTTAGAVSAVSAVITGAITGASATLSGALNATSANISGALAANSIDVGGAIEANSAAIAGAVVTDSLEANSLALTGSAAIGGDASVAGNMTSNAISANSAEISGAFTAGSVDTTGALVAGSIETAGALVAGSIETAGALSAGSVETAGALIAGSVETGGALSAGSAAITGALTADSLEANSATIHGSINVDEMIAPSATISGTLTAGSTVTSATETNSITSIDNNSLTLSATGGIVFGPVVNVTQTTSASTAVTCNGRSGVITTASLNGLFSSSFTVNNSLVGANSLIFLTIKYSGSLLTNGYPLVLTGTQSAGSFVIRIANTHLLNALTGTLSIGYLVIN